MKTYSELMTLPTFEERFEYLRTNSKVSDITFGSRRYLNQVYYRSKEWRKIRDDVIIRDGAYDLAFRDDLYYLNSGIVIHHIIPLREYDIIHHTEFLTNPEFLITTCDLTHKALHYGSLETLRPMQLINRFPNDTCPWRNQ